MQNVGGGAMWFVVGSLVGGISGKHIRNTRVTYSSLLTSSVARVKCS